MDKTVLSDGVLKDTFTQQVVHAFFILLDEHIKVLNGCKADL